MQPKTCLPLSAVQVLDREFLELRAKILELAASFDRLDRADGSVRDDPRHYKLAQAIDCLLSDHPNRAEQIQLLFSRPYEGDWQSKLGVERHEER